MVKHLPYEYYEEIDPERYLNLRSKKILSTDVLFLLHDEIERQREQLVFQELVNGELGEDGDDGEEWVYCDDNDVTYQGQ
jgi:hypothetical protein